MDVCSASFTKLQLKIPAELILMLNNVDNIVLASPTSIDLVAILNPEGCA